MKILIWGVGIRGSRLYDILGSDRVEAFIDNNKEIEMIDGKLVMDFDTYSAKYGEEIVVISNSQDIPIVNQMVQGNAMKFMLYNDCPQPMLQNSDIDKLKAYVESRAGNSGIAIYGISVYSLLVYEWMEQRGNPVYLVKEQPCKENIDYVVSKLKKHNYKIVECQDDLPSSVTKFFIAIATIEEVKTDLEVIDIFDFSSVYTEHFNPKLINFKNIHKNQRCFIVATGPSIQADDLERLYDNQEICISMNKIFYGFDETKWRPDYYIASDPRVIERCKEEILNLDAKSKFITDYDGKFWEDCSQVNVYKFYEYRYNNSLLFAKDISKGFQGGKTVTFLAIQLAAYMGFREIYLLGVDHSFGEDANAPERHFYGIKDTKAFKAAMVPEFMTYIERSYKTAERYSKTHGFRIYNATRGGNLEIFERVNFDELFD